MIFRRFEEILSAFSLRRGAGRAARQEKFGELRWSNRIYFFDQDGKNHSLFRRRLMDSESYFCLAPYANNLCKLPESVQCGGPEWCKELSSGAKRYLEELENLYRHKPITAIKIAGIVSATTPKQYLLSKNAASCLCRWLRQEEAQRRDYIELGLVIHGFWPDRLQRMDGLEETLLELLVKESESSPEYVLGVTRPLREKFGGETNYIFSAIDDPGLLLTLGRNLKQAAPEFAKKLFMTYLFHGRQPVMSFQASDLELRQAADELFAFESQLQSSDRVKSGFVYSCLCQWGFPDSEWYPTALERLYEVAAIIDDKAQAAIWYREVTFNAAPESSLRGLALDKFSAFSDGYTTLQDTDRKGILAHALFVLKSCQIASEDGAIWGRNASLAPNPLHPVACIAANSYWGLVAWLTRKSLAFVLPVLVEAVEYRNDEKISKKAALLLTEVFSDMLKLNVHEAECALYDLAKNAWYSNTTPSRKKICLELFHHLSPILGATSAEAELRAKKGLVNPAWDR